MIKFPGPEADMISPHAQATRLSPISKVRKDKVLADYGLAPGAARGKNQTQLSDIAAQAVLTKFARDKEKAAAEKRAAEEAARLAAAQAAAAAARLPDAEISAGLARAGIGNVAVPDWAKASMGSFNTWIAQYQSQQAAATKPVAPVVYAPPAPMLPNTAMVYKPPVAPTYAKPVIAPMAAKVYVAPVPAPKPSLTKPTLR